MKYIDVHCHLDGGYYGELSALFAAMKEAGVEKVISAGFDLASSQFSKDLSERFGGCYFTAGVHPTELAGFSESALKETERLAAHPKCVAIGEIGLDFYYDHSPRDEQRYWFKRQLALAEELDMPIIVHSREASQECFDIIKSSAVRKGVIHCYSGSAPMALDYIDMGFYIGVGGSLTFKNNKKTAEVVEKAPIERILIETDAPYLAPEPFRGRRNDSRLLKYVVERIASIKNMDEKDICNITKNNAFKLFIK